MGRLDDLLAQEPLSPRLPFQPIEKTVELSKKFSEFAEKLPISQLTVPIKAAGFLAPRTKTELALQVATPLASKSFQVASKLGVTKLLPNIFATTTGAPREAFEIAATKKLSPFIKEFKDSLKASQVLESTQDALLARKHDLGKMI